MMGGMFDGAFMGFMGMMSYFGQMMTMLFGSMFESMQQVFNQMMA